MDEQRVFLRPPLWLPFLVVALGGLFYISGKMIETENSPGQAVISVSGEGRVFVLPDIAEISVGVQTGRQPTADAAMQSLKEAMDGVIAALQEQGIEQNDIRTENFWLNPAYDWREGEQIPRGFEANQSLRVKVRNMDNVSAVIGAATAAGANQVGSVQFTVDDPDAKQAEAREQAIEEAREKAVKLADQLGVRLGDIVGFNEGFGGAVPPMYREGMGGMDMAQSSVALPPGEQEINVNVSITYEID